jgi:hypothetical protein
VALDRDARLIQRRAPGPPEGCVRGLREIADAGAEMILLNPLFEETA